MNLLEATGISTVAVSGLAAVVGGLMGAASAGRVTGRRHRVEPSASIEPSASKAVVVVNGPSALPLLEELQEESGGGYRLEAVLDIENESLDAVADRVRAAAEESQAGILVIAVPSAASDLIRELVAVSDDLGMVVLVLPEGRDIVGAPHATDLRPVNISDQLDRREITFDVEAVGGMIAGRRVLLAGAGSALGTGLAQQIARYGPAQLLLLDRDESGLIRTQLALHGWSNPGSDELLLVDASDAVDLADALRLAAPEVVINASSKGNAVMERSPLAAWKNNVVATLNLLHATRSSHLETFIHVSGTSAARPSSVTGATLRIAEGLVADFARRTSANYSSFRVANLDGGAGSVITTMAEQLNAGNSISLPHPYATRHFMSLRQALESILQSGTLAGDGSAILLQGMPKISFEEVAAMLMRASGRATQEMVATGLSPSYEPLDEILYEKDAVLSVASNPDFLVVQVEPIDAGMVSNLDFRTNDEVRAWISRPLWAGARL